MDPLEPRIAEALQRGLPLSERPYAEIADSLACEERQVLDGARALTARGLIRSIGVFPDYERLGCSGLLFGMEVPAPNLDAIVETLNDRNEITHNYLRAHRIGLWFTAICPTNETNAFVDAVLKMGFPVVVLETIERLKLSPNFRMHEATGATTTLPQPDPVTCNAAAKAPYREEAIRLLAPMQRDFPVVERPFDGLAQDLGLSTAQLLEKLRSLQQAGLLRRIGASLHHRRVGYAANALLAWEPREGVQPQAAATTLLPLPWVSHCYLRRCRASTLAIPWPYRIYTMIHARDETRMAERIETVRRSVASEAIEVLRTLEEYKKSRYLLGTSPADKPIKGRTNDEPGDETQGPTGDG